MKKVLITLLLISLLCSVAFAEEVVPNLIGTWEGTSVMHKKGEGFKEGKAPVTFVIKEQEGRVFFGEKVWILNGEECKEEFSGVISIDNTQFYIAEHVDGLTIGDIVSEDEIVVYYLEPGEAAKVIVTELDRVK